MNALSFVIGAAAAFVLLPWADALSWQWIASDLIAGYGLQDIKTLRLFWKGLIALLLFASIRAALSLLFSAASLALAMRLLPKHRRTEP
jgi:hypothetical protein